MEHTLTYRGSGYSLHLIYNYYPGEKGDGITTPDDDPELELVAVHFLGESSPDILDVLRDEITEDDLIDFILENHEE